MGEAGGRSLPDLYRSAFALGRTHQSQDGIGQYAGKRYQCRVAAQLQGRIVHQPAESQSSSVLSDLSSAVHRARRIRAAEVTISGQHSCTDGTRMAVQLRHAVGSHEFRFGPTGREAQARSIHRGGAGRVRTKAGTRKTKAK